MGDLLDDLKIFILHLYTGAKLFQKRRVNLVAGSATFFAILSSLPLVMLVVTAVGEFFNDYSFAKDQVLIVLKQNFPNLSPWILSNIEKIINLKTENRPKLDYLGVFFLLFFSIAFFSAILNGIDIITRNFDSKNLANKISSILGIALTVVFFIGIVFISPIASSLENLATDAEFVAVINQIPKANMILNILNNLGASLSFVITSPLFIMLICLGYFTFLYAWIFRFKEPWSDCFYGALTFAGAFMLGKSFFWLYVLYATNNIKQNFGDFYTLILALMWVYFVMCAFFYGACVVHGDPEGELIANN